MYPSTSASYGAATPAAPYHTAATHHYAQPYLSYTMPKSPSNASMANGACYEPSAGGSVSPAQMSLRSGASFMIGGTASGAGGQSIGDSASLIFASTCADDDALMAPPTNINLQIFIPELQIQKCLNVSLDELVWDIKRRAFDSVPQKFQEFYNYGLFLPPCDGRAGKFLLDDRSIRDYPFHDCAPYVELKYKTRVYKELKLDDKAVRHANNRSSLKKFMEYVHARNVEKIEKMCRQGLDPNFHDSHGYTPLTLAAEIPENRDVLVQLVGGGAHIDFRSNEGQTGLHRAAFLSLKSNVKTLLELGASPNYRDLIGLTPLYYNMLTTDSDPQLAELLLSEGAEVVVHDMHANDPLHQACKNGLMKHAEHLLFYGSNINAQNVNGNTPLHVCAVNNRVDCARMLLYRGADINVQNKHGQTAEHVARIVNNVAVADVIQSHTPDRVVPFRGTPKYNMRRRMTNSQIQRRRSLSHCSMSSLQSANGSSYHVAPPVVLRPQPIAPKCAMPGDYGTLKKCSMEEMQACRMAAQVEPNVPRILVIPRGQKGFGFILRGANHLDPDAAPFEPTPAVPALQFFEGVEKLGMAMKAGLRPGDFLLEINGVDVRRASHEQVVGLINQAEETITLKVITIEINLPPTGSTTTAAAAAANYHYVPPTIATRRNQSGSYLTSNGVNEHYMPNSITGQTPPAQLQQQQLRCASVKGRPSPSRRISAAELEHLIIRQTPAPDNGGNSSQFQPQSQSAFLSYNQDSLKSNGGAGGPKKFTSIAEMKRRKEQTVANPLLQRTNSASGGVPVSSMLRQFDDTTGDDISMCSVTTDVSAHFRVTSDLKSFNSTPDLAGSVVNFRTDNSDDDYARRYILRPKTPPPPPPSSQSQRSACVTPRASDAYNSSNNATYELIPASGSAHASTSDDQAINRTPNATTCRVAAPVALAPPPAPPPPPPNFLKNPSLKAATETSSKPVGNSAVPSKNPATSNPKTADCRGISAEALMSVKLKKVCSSESSRLDVRRTTAQSSPVVEHRVTTNFDIDLRSALARRRSKNDENGGAVALESGVTKFSDNSQSDTNNTATASSTDARVLAGSVAGRYGGLSLRESVHENVQPPAKSGSKASHHSPTGGLSFATKKDSGYTSSRTSLEPSECGDEPLHQNQKNPEQSMATAPSGAPTFLDNSSTSSSSNTLVDSVIATAGGGVGDGITRADVSPASGPHVTLISQQIEDEYGSPIQRLPTNATVCRPTTADVEVSRPLFLENPAHTPPVDYDDDCTMVQVASSDSGKSSVTDLNSPSGKSTPNPDGFRMKPLVKWSVDDVGHWLAHLQLRDHYANAFSSRAIDGARLASFDRAQFTQLGVTRVAHRQTMEQSLREFNSGR